jgi:hypothetical protein
MTIHPVANDRPELRDTLRLCVAALEELLDTQMIPGYLRSTVRICRALGRDALDHPAQDKQGPAR